MTSPVREAMESGTAFPGRIVCLTEETTETLYLLKEDRRIVGISAYTCRPPQSDEKPRVSAFTSARYDKILELRPDLVLAFSDLQADVAAELIRRGLNVFTFNQRSVAEILEMVAAIARIVGALEKGEALVARLRGEVEAVRDAAARLPRRPRVFFEEWNDPLISGIAWVEELVEAAGGELSFPELRGKASGKERIVSAAEAAARRPEVIIASWCGRKVKKEEIRARPGWSEVPAVRAGHIYAVDPSVILQPGPAALTEGVRQLHTIIAHAAGARIPTALEPAGPLDPDLQAARAAAR